MGKLNLIGIEKIKIDPPKLNVINIAGLQRDEDFYSDLLFYLFKSNEGNKFILNILKIICINYPSELLEAKMEVRREYHRIDVTILFNKNKYIIGIENKIDAGEGEKQIEGYQEILSKYYSDFSGIYLFLTPDGREPETDKKDSKFKCYNISYKDILKSLYMINKYESIKNCVNTFIDCIEENIVMNDKNTETICEIWGNKSNRDKLKVLFQERPKISSIKDKLYEKINKYLATKNDAINEKTTISAVKELHLRVKSLNHTNIPVIFMFYDDINSKENTPLLRIVLWHEDFEVMPKKRIKYYKEKYDFLAFEKIKNWTGWIALYTGKSLEADFSVTVDHDYGKKLVAILFNEFKKEYEKILTFI